MSENVIAQNDLECLDELKVGRFELTSERSDGYYVIRKKRKQIEVFNNGKSKMIMKINWISDEHFILTTKRLINVPERWGEKKGKVINITILSCDGEIYSCSSERKGKPPVITEFKKRN